MILFYLLFVGLVLLALGVMGYGWASTGAILIGLVLLAAGLVRR